MLVRSEVTCEKPELYQEVQLPVLVLNTQAIDTDHIGN